MYKLAPSLLAADFSMLGSQIVVMESAGAHYLHMDIMDGHFVPNISFGLPVLKSIRGLTDMTFDVHLMISEPEKYLEAFAVAGADILNFHAEVCRDTEHMLDIIREIRKLNKRAAITVNPETDLNKILDVVEQVEMVLLMSVHPGFGGQVFITETLNKVHSLADFITNKKLLTEIEIDGGITINNVRDAINSGANIIVVGTSVFNADDIGAAVRGFYDVFKEFGAVK